MRIQVCISLLVLAMGAVGCGGGNPFLRDGETAPPGTDRTAKTRCSSRVRT